ncbi:hypothetical protein [Glaciimonas sp. PCH181]|uniref:hypothetical protein n=1 Tax=Glaciimonas sp. PCH181 TaxID=2133943 RepID=UPI000D3343EE|nr:hypothetical protein [Glaciimonas sp. PCH181]PUA17298.1 hypothetical protein C7W93_15330 [Glaciimonas sp. PCH181]
MNRLIVLLCFILNACASTTQFQSYPDLDPSTPTATIHVVRSNSAFGAAITAPVYVDRYLIGRIGPGGYLKTLVPIGRIHVTSTTGDSIIQTEKNSEYFFEVSMPGQVWLYAPDFNIFPINKNRAQEILSYDPSTAQAPVAYVERQSVAPASNTPSKPYGEMSASVERLARQSGCDPTESATLIGKTTGIETYQASCKNGQQVLFKCEMRQCRMMN